MAESIQAAANELGISAAIVSASSLKEQLVKKINDLLQHDFNKLISILYRMDVSEQKLMLLLKDNPAQDAALIIAELVIERQAQKIESRKQFPRKDAPEDEYEKW